MKESHFYKNYFNELNLTSKFDSLENQPIQIKLSFLSNKDIKIARSLVDEINNRFTRNLILLTFLPRSADSLSNDSSSFNFVLTSKNKLPIFLFFDLLFKLNILFSIVSVDSNLDLFSINFFKAFEKNKLILDLSRGNFVKNFSKSFLFYLKKIEFYNSIRFLKLLKTFSINRI